MPSVSKIIEALQIINRSKPEGEDDCHFSAEHDEIFVGDLDWDMPKEDKARLKYLGFSADKKLGCWKAFV